MMANPSIHFRKLIEKYQCVEGLAINKTDLLKKCQTWQLLMVEPSIVAMFVKLCIYGRNQASVFPCLLPCSMLSLSCADIKSGHLIKYEAGTFEPGLPKKLIFDRPQNSVCASS